MTKSDSLKVLIISLDTDIRRREACISQLLGCQYDFVSAIDGRGKKESISGLVTSPIEAIWQSHNLALRKFLASDSRYCLILEDDFLVKKRKKFDTLVREILQEDFDLVQVGWLVTGVDIVLLRTYEGFLYALCRALNQLSRLSYKLTEVLTKRLRPRRCAEVPKFAIPDSFFPGAHAYLVSRNLAETILNLNNPIFLAVDDFYAALAKMRSFNVFRTRRSFVGQQGKSSAGINRFTRR